jgi:DNA (cytosine-5)-methyltransferase 1
MTDLVLSLFPGIGLLDRAFEDEGFCVVRGPDLLWGGDIHRFHPPAGRFAGIIGGPPCQRFSRLAALVVHNGYELAPDLIPEFARVVREAEPAWFLMENVPAAPAPPLEHYPMRSVLFNNRWAGGEQNRVRRFTFGVRAMGQLMGPVLLAAFERELRGQDVGFESIDYTPAVCASGSTWQPVRIGGSGKQKRKGRVYGDKSTTFLRQAIKAQGLPEDFDIPEFTIRGAIKAVGNGVPLPLGRAVARAVRAALAPAVEPLQRPVPPAAA